MDIKATKTVSMAIATFYICYIPAIIVSIWYHDTGENTRSVWAAYMATVCTFISSASNPVIYVLRNRRYRCAFWQLVKDPCGARAFQEKPVRARKPEEKQQEKKPPIEGEPGVSKRPESETLKTPASTKSAMFQSNRVTTWEENDSLGNSLDEQLATEDKAETINDQDFKSVGLVAEGAKKMTNATEKKGIETFTGKIPKPQVHPGD